MPEIAYLIEDFILAISGKYLWLIFFLVITVVIIFSLILNYHWKSLDTKLVVSGRRLYFGVLFLLLFIAVWSLISFQISQ